MIDLKYQTKRTTKMLENIEDINLFISDSFNFGVITFKYWGNFEKRDNPLIELGINKDKCQILLSDFIKIIELKLKKLKIKQEIIGSLKEL